MNMKIEFAGDEPFHPDWDRIEALKDTLREHQEMLKQYRTRLAECERERDALKVTIASIAKEARSTHGVTDKVKAILAIVGGAA